ncbi:MAG TPA: PAS domain S-box protein [Pyrinomonadaceae bacterium]|nr:PAS domain S-box protein [Pyrinomonadaceae bacterium]
MRTVLSIALQILLAVIVTVVVVLGISSVIELNILQNRERQQLQARGTVTADRISNSLAYPLWNLNQVETERVVLDELAAQEVARVEVLDEHGQLYIGKFKAADGSIQDLKSNNTSTGLVGGNYSFSREVYFRGNRIGSVKLDVSAAYLQPEMAKLRWGIAIKLFLLVVILSVVLSIALRVLVVRRLSKLKSWVEDPQAGKTPPHFKYSAEINSLAEAFGKMSIDLRHQHDELEQKHARLLELNTQLQEKIEERKQSQEELRRYADEVRDLYNNAPCGYHSLDENGHYVLINDTELNWLGYTREEVIGKLRFSDFLIPEHHHIFAERYPQFLSKGSVKDVEYQLLSKDGSTRTVLLSATSSKNVEGKFVMSRATVYDITDRRQAEELVERSEEKFARAFRSSPVGLAVTRVTDGQFIEVNEAATSFLGYTTDELIGRTTLDLGLWPNPDDRKTLIDELTQHGSVRAREIRFLTKQGKEVLCEYAAEQIEVNGEQCVLSVLLDITERRYIEQALRANEELLRLFVKHTPAAIAMFNTEMRYLQVSDRFLKDYHLEGQDIIGKVHYDVFPNLPERWKAAHQRILAGAVEHQDEDPFEEPDGSQGWLAWESLPWRTADGEIGGLILFTQVITQRKRAEQALRSSEERFAKIFNLSPYRMGILRASDGLILDVNECWLKETGFSREETVNHSVYELGQWLSEDTRKLIHDLVEEKKPFTGIEGAMKTKAGDERYMSTSAALVEFDGELCYLWASTDITERRLAEEEKRELIHDLGERVKELTALHQTARILQDEKKSLPHLLQEIVLFLPPAWQYPEVTAARIRFGDLEFKTRGFASTPWSQRVEFSGGHLKGEIEVVYLKEMPPEDIGPFLSEEASLINSLAEMISSALDRRYAQTALQESEEVFRTLTETVSAGIYIYRDAEFVYVNPKAEELTGYLRDELLSMSLYDLVHPTFRDAVRERVKERELGLVQASRDEEKLLTKSGEERWMDVSAAPTKFRGEPAVIVTTFDITSRKRAEEELKASEEQLRALSAKAQSAREEEGTRIAREIHDELGGALTGLKWDLEGIDSRLSTDNGSSTISDVRKQISSMTGLIESTIDTVRRISSELRPGVLDDLGLVAAIEWQTQQFQRRTGLQVHWESDLEAAEVSHDGATAVFRIFQEVLTNVLRHSRANNIYVKLFQRRRQLELEVVDDGRGITDEEQKNTLSLGLLGMKERALLVGGEVSITGAEGQGTTVLVRIPLSKESESEAIA